MTLMVSHSPDTLSVPSGWTGALVRAGAARGIDRAQLLSGTGVSEADLDNQHGRICAVADTALWRRAVELLGDGGLGLELATAQLQPDSLGIVGLAAMTCETVTDAFATASRFHSMLCGDSHLEYRVGAVADVTHRYAKPDYVRPPAHAEATMAAALMLAKSWTGTDLQPLQVRFEHAKPAHADRTAETFGVEPMYNQRDTALVLARDFTTVRLRTNDAAIRDMLCGQLSARVPTHSDELIHHLRQAIASAVATAGQPTLSDMAAQLGTTTRTLQRRLALRGVAYRALVNEVRMDAAAQLLSNSHLSIAGVADRLGYANSAAFRRAFRNWTGIAPGRFRDGASERP